MKAERLSDEEFRGLRDRWQNIFFVQMPISTSVPITQLRKVIELYEDKLKQKEEELKQYRSIKLPSKPIWTYEQVIKLNNRQRNGLLHPYTCGNRSNHPLFDDDRGVLVATIYGWICPFCDYRQDWAGEIKSDIKEQL